MNLFASASKKQPLAKPIEQDIPNPFQRRLHAFRRRCNMGRYLHQSTGVRPSHAASDTSIKPIGQTYVKPKEDEK